ncbi:hypothetical protein MTBBW1_2510015 [Desulfamplus magnetovallimortis]|uniref:Methyltransferase domain-containing protein n=1 Tax=Desulfamplus magnetovallimortis TaxID=1246637 RepID=A0A1W1HEI1_9BACT|nr:methyltransferase domain-containing protein [Desulfamplus magnetovallimortis]SLM30897.1 hypothetical protein MTBBW1_2510015 [Desulfamplus magnetovallimortis]
MTQKKLIIIFGASSAGKRALNFFSKTHDILCFVDNDSQKQKNKFLNKNVISPDEIKDLNWDKIMIASIYSSEIKYQLIEMGIQESLIDCVSDDIIHGFPGRVRGVYHFFCKLISRLKSRIIFLLWRSTIPHISFFMNELGIYFLVWSKKLLHLLGSGIPIQNYPDRLLTLHKKIRYEQNRYNREYEHLKYFGKYPLQGLALLGIFGGRGTEERFDDYRLNNIIHENDRILDIGCANGFMTLYTAFRTGCQAEGIDINPHLIKIGQYCTDFLKLTDCVHLHVKDFQMFEANHKYSVVFSFAAHHTWDNRHRPDFDQYIKKIYDLLSDNGYLLFETHSSEVGTTEFYQKMKRQGNLFSCINSTKFWNEYPCRREFFVMKKIPSLKAQPKKGEI